MKNQPTRKKISTTKAELRLAFKTYDDFKQYIKRKFNIDLDYLDYLDAQRNSDKHTDC